jgi:hypothetical protein
MDFIYNVKYGYMREREEFASLSHYLNNNTNNIIVDAMNSIIAIGRDFMQYPDKYLTESDVRCFLFNEFMHHPSFNSLSSTSDGSQSIPVHTEVRWYGNEGKLKYRSDMVIIETSDLITKGKFFKLPSKGFGFNKFNAIVEIKLRRSNGENYGSFIKKIEYDIEKLIKIEKDVAEANILSYASFVVILDKKNENNNMHNLIEHKFLTLEKYHPEMDLFIYYARS